MRRHVEARAATSITVHGVSRGLFGICLCVCALAALLAGGASSAFAETCPNEQLRIENNSTALPDCRAYEMVTPPFKYGQPAYNGAGQPVIAADGSLEFNSLGAFNDPGIDALPTGPTYLASRTAASWSAEPIVPQADQLALGSGTSEFSGESPDDLTSDLSRSIYALVPKGALVTDRRLYIRGSGGTLTEIGPMLPPSAVASWTPQANESPYSSSRYVGASTAFSHTFFWSTSIAANNANNSWLWPGDQTVIRKDEGLRSLYEYSGIGNTEPELVAVTNPRPLTEEAQLQGKTHINEAADLISQCGAELGAVGNTDAYDAISHSGDTVFFTVSPGGCEGLQPGEVGEGPAVAELYARVNREKTVAISEPSVTDCSECETFSNEPESRSPGIFQGASADGSKVYFLSTQKLFSGNDGEEGVNLYQFDFGAPAGERVSLIAPEMTRSFGAIGGVVRVSQDGTHVYFVSGAVLASNQDAKESQAQPGAKNLYVYDAASKQYRFIAAMSGEDSEDWQSHDERPAETTSNGRFLLFSSVNDLTRDASGSGGQLYRYDAQTGTLNRLSIGSEGFGEDGNNGWSSLPLITSYAHYDRARPTGVSLSDDGSKAFFASIGALTPNALDAVCGLVKEGECWAFAINIYEWEQSGFGSCPASEAGGCMYLLSDGHDTRPVLGSSAVTLLGADPSGKDVFFTTADSLVPADSDGQMDIYDARTEGGFPIAAQPSTCQGDTCQGAQTPPSVDPGAATSTFVGPPNQHRKPNRKHRKRSHRHRAQTQHNRGGSR